MSSLFITLLALHVLIGVAGVIASFMLTYMLIRDSFNPSTLMRTAWFTAISYAVSWFVGGWYYWKHYGLPTKDGVTYPRTRIVEGEYAWAHYIFTEAKEHAFMFLPFAACALALLIQYRSDSLKTDATLRTAVLALACTIAVVGTVITVSGIIMSGAAR